MNNKMIGVIGGGSWATAIVKILLENSKKHINWWVRRKEACDAIMHSNRNPHHLTDVQFQPGLIHADTDLSGVVGQSSHLILAIPSAYLHTTLSQLSPDALKGKKIVSAIKGVIPECCMGVSYYLERHYGVKREDICIVSGPSHAEEVSRGMPTFLTFASSNEALAREMEQEMQCPFVHTSATCDTEGVEGCGLGKNIYAIAAGICQGLGYGDNFNAVLTAAAARELQRLIDLVHPYPGRDFNAPCYLGDLLVTCWSRHSRNRALGEAVGKGASPAEVLAHSAHVAEGYYSAKSLHLIASQRGLDGIVPIAEAVYRILHEASDPKKEIAHLIKDVL